NSFASCAARVLLCDITRVGRCTCSMSHAVVADLPVPVAPSSTTSVSPALMRAVSSLIAAGWSPLGVYSLTTSNGRTDLVGCMNFSLGGGTDSQPGGLRHRGTERDPGV